MKRTLVIGPEEMGEKYVNTQIIDGTSMYKLNGSEIRTGNVDDQLYWLLSNCRGAGDIILIKDVPKKVLGNVVTYFYSEEYEINPKGKSPYVLKASEIYITCDCQFEDIQFLPSLLRRFELVKCIEKEKPFYDQATPVELNLPTKADCIKIFEQISKQLTDIRIDKNEDAYVFLSAIRDGKGHQIEATVSGSNTNLTTLFLETMATKEAPDDFKKVLLLTAANLLADSEDSKGRILSKALGTYTEDIYGKITCECSKCKAKRLSIN